MRALKRPRLSRTAVTMAVMAMVFATAGVAVGAGIGIRSVNIITPHSEDQVTNLDVLRLELKNYYGTPGAATGSGPTAGWTLALVPDSYYAQEAQHIADLGWNWLHAKSNLNKPHKAIVFDVDDTTLTTWNYELYSNWDYNPGTNEVFVGLTTTNPGPPAVKEFTGNMFPATPGMVELAWDAYNAGYAIFWITGRPPTQEQVTLANLVNDTAAGFPADVTTTGFGNHVPEIDAGYPMPTVVTTGVDGLFTKPGAVADYPAYLVTACAGDPGGKCTTIHYKSATRAYIESFGWDIVASFGDQYSDLIGGYADKVFKMPNPNYYLP